MVGLVIISHCKKISDGICELAAAVWKGDVNLISAGGLEDGSLGTDAVRIMNAIRKADQGDGVLILCDIGSSVMSAETAMELLGDEVTVHIADAPIVEGAIAAAVEAGSGSDLEETLAAAESVRHFHKLT